MASLSHFPTRPFSLGIVKKVFQQFGFSNQFLGSLGHHAQRGHVLFVCPSISGEVLNVSSDVSREQKHVGPRSLCTMLCRFCAQLSAVKLQQHSHKGSECHHRTQAAERARWPILYCRAREQNRNPFCMRFQQPNKRGTQQMREHCTVTHIYVPPWKLL